jgi:hypothetical protein
MARQFPSDVLSPLRGLICFGTQRQADAAEDQAFQQEMLSIQSQSLPPINFQPPPTVLLPSIQQPEQPTLILVPGQGTFVASPERPGQPQLITGPGLNGPIIISH